MTKNLKVLLFFILVLTNIGLFVSTLSYLNAIPSFALLHNSFETTLVMLLKDGLILMFMMVIVNLVTIGLLILKDKDLVK